MGVGAERAAAVGHDLAVGRQLVEAPLELVERDRARALDVAGLELLGGPHVDEHHVAAGQPGEQLVAADRLDVLAEVLARGALDLGQARGRRLAQGEPEREHVVAGERVADALPVAPARDESGRVQRLQVLRGVGVRLPAARASSSTVRGPARAGRAARAGAGWRKPCPSPRSPRTARPSPREPSPCWLFKRSIDNLSSLWIPAPRRPHVLPPAAQRRDRLRLVPARLQEPRPARRRRPARRPRRRVHRPRRGAGRADRGRARDARAGRPRLGPARAGRAHRRDGLPARGRRRRVRPPPARRRRDRRRSATPSSRRSPRPATPTRITPTWSPTTPAPTSRGWS